MNAEGHSPQPGPRKGLRILIADDNRGTVFILSKMLELLGEFEVRAAPDGRAALRAASEFRPELIILDVHLPDMHGEDVVRILRSDPETRETLIVAHTADAMQGARERYLAAGFDMYLAKPAPVEELREVLSHPMLRACSPGASDGVSSSGNEPP